MEKAKTPTYGQIVTVETTVDQFINDVSKGIPTSTTKLTPDEFLTFPTEGDNNLNRIWTQYTKEQKKEYESDYNSKSLTVIKAGTSVLLPAPKIEIDLQKLANQGQFLKQGDFGAYWSEKYAKMIANINFQPDSSETNADANGTLRLVPLSLRVWIYVKSLDKVLDISEFILSAQSSKVALSGNFSISVASFKSQQSPSGFSAGFTEHFAVTNADGVFQKSYLEKYITQNDIVFLRYEKLKIEKDPELSGVNDSIEIDKTRLVNQSASYNVWDMIGIVDNINVAGSFQGVDSILTISGKDFTKMFNEDGSYFMPLFFMEGSPERWCFGGDKSNSWYKRNIISGNYDYFFNYGFRDIKSTVWFIVNILSNIGIVPDSLFSSYKDRRTKAYTLTDDGEESKTQEVKGLWQIVQVFVEEQLNNRILVDSSFANPDGTLMTFLMKICQDPFVEILMDTYVDTMDIVIRQPPFTEKAIKQVISDKTYIPISVANTHGFTFSYDERVYSWYQIAPQNEMTGSSQFTTSAFVPIIYFDEFVNVFGNKKMVIPDIYLSYASFYGAGGTMKLNSFAAALLNDLLLVIEMNLYLPFTRRGTIVCSGDRRVKVGTFILFEPTNELFYVTGVSHSVTMSESIDHTTTIEVERGMLLPILKGERDGTVNIKTASGEVASYFKLFKKDEIKKSISEAQSKVKDDKSTASCGKVTTDKNQFDYFMNREMYKL